MICVYTHSGVLLTHKNDKILPCAATWVDLNDTPEMWEGKPRILSTYVRFPLPLGRRQRNLCSLEMGGKGLWVLTLTYRNVNKISPGVRESPVSGLLWPWDISHLFGHVNTQGDHTPVFLAPAGLLLCVFVCVCVCTCMCLGAVLQGQSDYWPSHQSLVEPPVPYTALCQFQPCRWRSCFLAFSKLLILFPTFSWVQWPQYRRSL